MTPTTHAQDLHRGKKRLRISQLSTNMKNFTNIVIGYTDFSGAIRDNT
jgi:hypothetical protein